MRLYHTCGVVCGVAVALTVTVRARATTVLFAGTGHYYELVEDKGITWLEAKAAAEAMAHDGMPGYLATITSAAENQFLMDHILGGYSDGEPYFIGGLQPPGSGEPGGGWQWLTGEPWSYTNWKTRTGEPNDLDDGPLYPHEDRLEIYDDEVHYGQWNDIHHDRPRQGYIVEFNPVPEPLTLLGIGAGIAALGGYVRGRGSRSRKRK